MSTDLTQPPPQPELQRCASCGDVVGVYEPYMLVVDEGPDPSSLAADPLDAGVVVATYHRACYEAFATSPAESRSTS